MKNLILVVALCSFSTAVFAEGPLRRLFGGGRKNVTYSYNNNSNYQYSQNYGHQGQSYSTQGYSGDLQSIAQARAQAMANADRYHGHNIPGAPGMPNNVFEGVGYNWDYNNPNTCNNGKGQLAWGRAQGASGRVYHVRFFQP